MLIPRTEDKNVVKNRWVFKVKCKANDEVDKYKARLVVRGCAQKEGIDYSEVFASVVRYESVPILLAIAAWYRIEIYQFDTFPHGFVDKNIYMEQPYVFEEAEYAICNAVYIDWNKTQGIGTRQ